MDTLNIGFDVVCFVLLCSVHSFLQRSSWSNSRKFDYREWERKDWVNEWGKSCLIFHFICQKLFLYPVDWSGMGWKEDGIGSDKDIPYQLNWRKEGLHCIRQEERMVCYVSSLTNLDKSKANYKWIKLNCYFSQFTLFPLVPATSQPSSTICYGEWSYLYIWCLRTSKWTLFCVGLSWDPLTLPILL